MWQVRGVSLIDPLFISKTTVSLWQHSAEATSKLVQSSVFSLCKKSLRSKEEPPEGAAIVTLLMYSGTSRHTRTQTPAHPPALIWMNVQSKWGSFVNRVSQTVLFKTQKQKAAKKRKTERAKLSLSPRSVWNCLNKSQRSPTKKIKKKIYQL